MSRIEHKRWTIRLKQAEAKVERRRRDHDGSPDAEAGLQAAKRELAEVRRQWRLTRPAPAPHTLNGDAVARPASIRMTSKPKSPGR